MAATAAAAQSRTACPSASSVRAGSRKLTTSVVPARPAAIARSTAAVASGGRYMVTPSQFQVARAGVPRSPIAVADRSAATNRTLAGSASRSAARFHAWVRVIDLPDHEVAGPGMTPGEGVQPRAEQHVVPPARG